MYVSLTAGLLSLTLLEKPLFGPPHAHMQQPTRCHFIGDLSPQGNPLHYLSSVRSLYDWYCNHSAPQQEGASVRPPLVVNTHGWIKVCRCSAPLSNAMIFSMLWSGGMCCAVLCCAVLCCAVLCCAVLCCAVLCCAVLCCAVLCSALLRCALLCCALLCS